MNTDILNINDAIIYRLNVKLANGTNYSWDSEEYNFSNAATIKFTCGLNIYAKREFPDYMNGAVFSNLVITSAKGFVYQENTNNSEVVM